MSESVSSVEREAHDRARADLLAQRRGHYRRLGGLAALDELGIAVSTGDRSLEALIADRDNLDHADDRRGARRRRPEPQPCGSWRHGSSLPAVNVNVMVHEWATTLPTSPREGQLNEHAASRVPDSGAHVGADDEAHVRDHDGAHGEARRDVHEEVGQLTDGRTIRFFSWATREDGR